MFPNPGAGRAPYFQSRVGFEGGSHAMRQQGAMYWYDLAQPGVADPATPGRICYVRRGLRYSLGEWPKEDSPYKGACT
ncbi:MAG: hypothetical protein JJD92_12455 [Frankiaceae bacterium]|nr:hypothetical protein [Frankiaceae bacterium]